ncbi:hypothetical protein E4631_05630 [Hymenobacter sp. UV11]|uniref:hypothetical protein n=1 Tax=Hymenobacter sp. UV11 TaxID=1849735 RepID=UPI00105D0D5C|nr:hypothetical protein [Hymenobacter sp. UV11]TDN35854.1 hypothetical protein A8B98_12470 [Hymenobacter sp. UV11]TFZ67464.1 hypothetical protein E4631_05630 [Hymenobacter sp. UV11]
MQNSAKNLTCGHVPNLAVEERIQTYWSAATANPSEYFQTDLGQVSTVRAVQINYADQGVNPVFMSRQPGLYPSI